MLTTYFLTSSTLDLILNFELLKPKCTLNRLIELTHGEIPGAQLQ